MATTVYLPDTVSEGGRALAAGITRGAENYMAQVKERERSERMNKVLAAIAAAPDRKTALSAVAASAVGATPDEVQLYFRAVDEGKPQEDDQLIESKVYSPVTGAETPFMVKKSDYNKLKDPAFVSEITGLKPEQFTTTKPQKIHTYVEPGTGHSVGDFVPGMQPPNSVTAEDFTRDRQLESDRRAQLSAERIAKRDQDIELDRQADNRRADRREARADANVSSDKDAKRVSIEQTRLQKYLVTQYGGKTLADGSLDLSSLDEPKRRKFTEEFDAGSAMLEDGRAKTFGAAVRALHKPVENSGFGNRPDGSAKGNGYLGVHKNSKGDSVTEYSVGVNINGKEVDVPSMVPTLTKAEIQQVLNASASGKPPPKNIIEKATKFAKQRIDAGKSPFADGGTPNNTGLPTGAKVGTVKSKTKDGKAVIEVLDSKGQRIGWKPL